MKAIIFRQHGGPDVLEYTDFPTPEPKPGEALLHLQAAALNRVDVTVRKGWPGLKLELPHIPGCDGAGTVAALGAGVTQLAVGDHVVINANLGCGRCEYCLAGQDNMCRNWHLLGETVRGTYAEYISLPERQLYKLPAIFDLREAAAAALVYQTAWHSLITRGQLRPDETVLIVGAGGGVNSASVQVAKLGGAKVISVASNAEKARLAESLGADLVIDRSKDEDWSKAAFLATGKRGVDVVVDNVGSTFMSSLRALRKGGRLLTVGNTGGPMIEIDNRYMFSKHVSIIGSTMSTLREFSTVMERLARDEQLGKITLDIG
jgi:NADPH:quinone reductase-like Zn-dependent oxidoreductase